MRRSHAEPTKRPMVVLLSEEVVEETYANPDAKGDNVFPLALAPEEAGKFVDLIESITPYMVELDIDQGLAFIQIFASTTEDVPDELRNYVDTLDEVTVTEGPDYLLVTLPPNEATEVVARSKDIMEEWAT